MPDTMLEGVYGSSGSPTNSRNGRATTVQQAMELLAPEINSFIAVAFRNVFGSDVRVEPRAWTLGGLALDPKFCNDARAPLTVLTYCNNAYMGYSVRAYQWRIHAEVRTQVHEALWDGGVRDPNFRFAVVWRVDGRSVGSVVAMDECGTVSGEYGGDPAKYQPHATYLPTLHSLPKL